MLPAVALRPGRPGILAILVVSGICDSYQVQANASFVAAIPDSLRGQASGLALGGMYLGQGTAMTVAGAAAGRADTSRSSPWPGLPGQLLSLSRSAVEWAYAHIVFRIAGLRSLS